MVDGYIKSVIEKARQQVVRKFGKASYLVPDSDAESRPSHHGLHGAPCVVARSPKPRFSDRSGKDWITTQARPLRNLNKCVFRELVQQLPTLSVRGSPIESPPTEPQSLKGVPNASEIPFPGSPETPVNNIRGQ